jgi:hypothetical protein
LAFDHGFYDAAKRVLLSAERYNPIISLITWSIGQMVQHLAMAKMQKECD